MKRPLAAVILMFVCTGVAISAEAEDKISPMGGCSMNENANISINFNGSDKDITAVRNKLDAKIEEIKTLASQQHFDKFILQSNNYNINSNQNNGEEDNQQYQYSGSATFNILPADKALDFMVILIKKGYHASANVNSYRNGNCNQL